MLQRDSSPAKPFLEPRQEIIALLSQRMGLNIQSVGNAAIERAINQAVKQSGLTDDRAYLQAIKISNVALEKLIDAVVIPETSFFRNPESFEYLAQHVLSFPRTRSENKPLRVLSLPCSSGEEPYSVAMTLLEAGLTQGQFQVDGIDISQKALAFAHQGIYGPYSFRNTPSFSPNYYLDKYFSQVKQTDYQIHDWVRSHVNFYPGNLSNAICLPHHAAYDIIFCRNLLIYFHQSAREQALHNLYRLLTPNGLLFVGYAETSQINQQQFISLGIPQAFVYQKISQRSTNSKRSLRSLQRDLPPKRKSVSPITKMPHQRPSSKRPPSKTPLEDLAKIRELADSGELTTALEQCDAYLKAYPMTAEAYLLLGEIYHAQGSDERADMAFHRTLYLQPNCVEALTYRLLLCDKKNDQKTAQQLRQRIYRLTQTN